MEEAVFSFEIFEDQHMLGRSHAECALTVYSRSWLVSERFLSVP